MILSPFLSAAGIGSPASVSARQRRPSMNQELFYRPEAQINPQEPAQYINQPVTGDIIKAHLERIKNRNPPPVLDPGSRVKRTDPNIADPNSFKNFYDQLYTIRQIGQDQTAAAAAKAAFSRLRTFPTAGPANPVTPVGTYRPTTGNSIGKAGSAALGSPPSNPATNFKYAQNIAGNYGWNSPSQLDAWYKLGMKESGWRNTAQNPTSTAFGIGQFLNSTWAGVGIPKTSDPALQVEAMARYIKNRYGSPSAALAFHLSHNWY